jgi:hydrogenase maturation factor
VSVVGPHCEHDRGCITCGDEGLAMEVLKLDPLRDLALCADERGRRETVEVGLVDHVERGDRLLVHAGTALTRLEAR